MQYTNIARYIIIMIIDATKAQRMRPFQTEMVAACVTLLKSITGRMAQHRNIAVHVATRLCMLTSSLKCSFSFLLISSDRARGTEYSGMHSQCSASPLSTRRATAHQCSHSVCRNALEISIRFKAVLIYNTLYPCLQYSIVL